MWYEKSAIQGTAPAQYQLAKIYLEGLREENRRNSFEPPDVKPKKAPLPDEK